MNRDFEIDLTIRSDSAQAEAGLARIRSALAQVDRALTRARAANRDVVLDAQASSALAAQRAITAEVERRTRLEADAAARNAAALRQQAVDAARIAERRAASTAVFSAASPQQLRTPAERTDALGQAQALRRDGELRMLEIQRRADALESRLATTRTALATATITAARATDVGRRAVDQYGVTLGQTRQAMRQLPAQITDIFTSLAGGQKPWLVAIQQGGQLKDSFGGVVPAARALLGALSPMVAGLALVAAVIGSVAVATVQGYRETQGYERALIASGNAAATTAGRLAAAKDAIGDTTGAFGDAQAALTALAGSGKVAGDVLQTAARAAVDLSFLTGASVEETTRKIIALAQAPSQQLAAFNQDYQFLSATVYQHVRALEAQGRMQDAARIAIEEFGRVHAQRVQEALEKAGFLERRWRDLAKVIAQTWQGIKDLGRDDAEFRSRQLSREMADLDTRRRRILERTGGAPTDRYNRSLLVGIERELLGLQDQYVSTQREILQAQTKADAQAKAQRVETNAINALGRAQAALGQDRAIGKAQQLRALERDIAALRAGGVKTVEGVGIDAFEKTRRAQIENQFKAPAGARPVKPKSTDTDRARESAERELESLRREVALLGEVEAGQTRAGEAARIRYETTQGALAKIAPALKAQLLNEAEALDKARAAGEAERERKAAIEKTTRAYDALREGLRTPAEVALATATEQVTLLNDALRDGIATKAAFDTAMARVVRESFRKPDAVPGAANALGDTGGELAQIEQARVRVQTWHAEQLALLAQFRAQRADLNAQWDAQEVTIEQQHQAALAQLQSAQTQVLLAGAESAFGSLAQIAKSFGGEQSAAYRALFALSKAFAIAQAALALANNVAEASKYGFPQNIPFIAGAIAQGATIASLIAQATFDGGGYATGGHVRGHVRGAGTSTSDSIVARLSDFEFVTRAGVVRQPGALSFLEDFNARGMPALDAWHARRFAGAAPPPSALPRAPRVNFADGGLARAAASLTPQLNLRLVNAIDTEALAESIATSRAMETTVLNVIDRNGSFLRQKVGG